MNLELSELFGGFDTLAGKSKTLTVSGGFTKNNIAISFFNFFLSNLISSAFNSGCGLWSFNFFNSVMPVLN